MALLHVITALLLALTLANVKPSTCYVVKGTVSCLDCKHRYDLSGIMVLVKCDKVKKLIVSTTKDDGSFATELPSDTTPQSLPQTSNCLAKLLGGPNLLYVSRQNMVSKIVEAHNEPNSYTISTPLAFSTTCPFNKNHAKCEAHNARVGSSKTVDIPLPREWGLAPSSYYIPFFPIIGVP